MSAPEPRENPRLAGHEAAEAAILEAMQSGRMHHAWLITGPAGVGKATLAFRFARRLLAGIPTEHSLALDPAHPVFRRVAAGTHADLLTVERQWDEKRKRARTEIVVEDVRQVTDFLRLTPAEEGWRVVVLDGAEFLNRNAANALLKVLEEPPARALLLLACASPGRLLPTIRSRCRRLRLTPLDDRTMDGLLADYLPALEGSDRKRLIGLADGSPGRALMLAEEQGLALAASVEEVLQALPEYRLSRAYELADAVGRGEGGFPIFMDLLCTALARAVRNTVRGQASPVEARVAALRPLDAWGDVWHALLRLQDETERFNLDKRQAVVSGIAMLNGTGLDPLPTR